MSKRLPLRAPLGVLFEKRLEREHANRLWAQVRARAERPRAFLAKGMLAFAFGIAVTALAVLAFSSLKPSALRLRDGHALPESFLGVTPFDLDDGSQIVLGADAQLDVLDSTGRAFTVALRRGTSEFDVRPGGPRSWRIECGPILVEVVGTHFTVFRTAQRFRVSVSRGVVLVRGDAIRDYVQRLTAGQSLEVSLENPSEVQAADIRGSAHPELGSPATPAENDAVAMSRPTAVASRGRAAPREESAAPSAAVASPAPSAVESAPAAREPVQSLLTSADLARREGHPHEAAASLELLVREYPSDSRAPLAEFSLGHLYLDALGDAATAAVHFERALAGRLPATLSEDALARLVQSRARAGESLAARAAALRYRAAYPGGRWSADVETWSAGSP